MWVEAAFGLISASGSTAAPLSNGLSIDFGFAASICLLSMLSTAVLPTYLPFDGGSWLRSYLRLGAPRVVVAFA